MALVRDTVFRVVYFPFHDHRYSAPVEVAQAGWFKAAFLSLNGDTLRIAEYRSDVILDFVWDASKGSFRELEDSAGVAR